MASIEIEYLKECFSVASGANHAVDDTTLKIEKGHTVRIAGESGCDKSTLSRTIIHLHGTADDVIRLSGKDITHALGKELKQTRKKTQVILQGPYTPLNPRMIMEATIRKLLVEAHRFSKTEVVQRTEELMDRVGTEERLRLSYPHELDGGWRQRISIARAIALNPEPIMCDEPVDAPDVSIQAQVLSLPMGLQEECGLAYMFVTYDLPVVWHISDDISVMYLGQLAEASSTKELFHETLHPCIEALLSAISSMDIHHPMQWVQLKGEITSAINPKPGCRLAPRCPCTTEAYLEPQRLEETEPKHSASCHRVREISSQTRRDEA